MMLGILLAIATQTTAPVDYDGPALCRVETGSERASEYGCPAYWLREQAESDWQATASFLYVEESSLDSAKNDTATAFSRQRYHNAHYAYIDCLEQGALAKAIRNEPTPKDVNASFDRCEPELAQLSNILLELPIDDQQIFDAKPSFREALWTRLYQLMRTTHAIHVGRNQGQ